MKARVLVGVVAAAGLVWAPAGAAHSQSQNQAQAQPQSQWQSQPQAPSPSQAQGEAQAPSQAQQISRGESLGEAARRMREQRRMTSVTEKVWTNDNIPGGEIGLVSRAPNADEFAIPVGAEQPGAAAPSPEEERARAAAETAVAEEKARLATLQNDLTLLQRDYDLSRQQFYSNPGYADDEAGQQRLSALQAQVDAKTADIAASAARVTALEQELAAINERLGPRPAVTPTPAELQAQWAARIEPLQRELQAVEAEIARVRAQIPSTAVPSGAAGSDFTQDQLNRLEGRRADLQRQIVAIQEDARRAGVPAGWTRPPL
ncbi:MAG: hypothetical protein ACRD6I_03810 [Candidatus Acidiferrales bacterium]